MNKDEIDFSHLTNDLDVDEERLEDALLALEDLCTFCETAPMMHDALGFPWCAEHEYRGEFVNYGASQGYPTLQVEGFAIEQGSWFWTQIALLGSEDCVMALMIEVIGREKEAA